MPSTTCVLGVLARGARRGAPRAAASASRPRLRPRPPRRPRRLRGAGLVVALGLRLGRPRRLPRPPARASSAASDGGASSASSVGAASAPSADPDWPRRWRRSGRSCADGGSRRRRARWRARADRRAGCAQARRGRARRTWDFSFDRCGRSAPGRVVRSGRQPSSDRLASAPATEELRPEAVRGEALVRRELAFAAQHRPHGEEVGGRRDVVHAQDVRARVGAARPAPPSVAAPRSRGARPVIAPRKSLRETAQQQRAAERVQRVEPRAAPRPSAPASWRSPGPGSTISCSRPPRAAARRAIRSARKSRTSATTSS